MGGLLTDSDIIVKIDTIGLTCSRLSLWDLLWHWKFSEGHRFDYHLSCVKVLFLLIWLQPSHWISRYYTDNQYVICLVDFEVAVNLWPYEMRSRLPNQFLFLPKVHSCTCKFIYNSSNGLGTCHRQSFFCLKELFRFCIAMCLLQSQIWKIYLSIYIYCLNPVKRTFGQVRRGIAPRKRKNIKQDRKG